MANTYTLIEAKTLATTTASVTFSSIPATYTDLLVMASPRSNNASTTVQLRIRFGNGTVDTGANYSSKFLYGDGAAAASGTATYIHGGEMDAASSTASVFSNHSIYVPNYLSSTNKSVSIDGVGENNATTAYAFLTAGLWTNTATINVVELYPHLGSFVQYSTFYLYGISKS
jgi:hypothetical protein